jgi:hypothetical protein
MSLYFSNGYKVTKILHNVKTVDSGSQIG